MRYCTRADVHVDRCASAWLIRRYLDPEAVFSFAQDQVPLPNTVPFDMHGVEWGHVGSRCTFETLLHLHHLADPVLQQMGRIIHGADIAADADETLESAGMDLLFRGLRLVSQSDDGTLERGYLLMDALYAALHADSGSWGPRG
jgi:hypothetical protein